MQPPVVIAARRTPLRTRGLADLPAASLAAASLAAVAADVPALLGDLPVSDVVLGNCLGPGGNLARVAALAAGLGATTPGMTVDRQCASGLAAIAVASADLDGSAVVRLAGGVESTSRAPRRPGGGGALRAPFAPPGFPDPEMGPAAAALGAARGIGRDRQDEYALRSHRLAEAAARAGRFSAEIAPLEGLAVDDGPRRLAPGTLARFPIAFGTGDVTAGNACRDADGSAAVAIVPEAARAGVPGLAVLGSAVTACDPREPGIAPASAIRAVLERSGRRLEELSAIEIVEAFAAQVLAIGDELGLTAPGRIDDRLAADGGAIALGHPWGASGAVAVVRLFSRLVRGGAPPGSLGLAAAAAGGGLGVATLFAVAR